MAAKTVKKNKGRALVLLSGGLDSMLVVKILQQQDFDVTGLVFTSYFFDDKKAQHAAKELGIKLIKKDFSEEHLKVVKKPSHGYGKGLNPCVDCHSLMLEEAKKIFLEDRYDILATGEVLGQRPFSQNKNVFDKIEKMLGLEGNILRPLSAKILPETKYEKSGLVKRAELFEIANKSRKEQRKLVEKFGIKEYATPSGGCVLAEPLFAKKISELLEFAKKPGKREFDLLRTGRHFWIEDKSRPFAWIILGKNKEENDLLKKSFSETGVVVEREDLLGPTALVITREKHPKLPAELTEETMKLIWKYSSSKKPKSNKLAFSVFSSTHNSPNKNTKALSYMHI